MEEVMWLQPSKAVNPSDNQLSVLKRLSDLQHNTLAFDMNIWDRTPLDANGIFR